MGTIVGRFRVSNAVIRPVTEHQNQTERTTATVEEKQEPWPGQRRPLHTRNDQDNKNWTQRRSKRKKRWTARMRALRVLLILQAPTSGFIPLRQKATIVATAVSFTMLSPIVALPRENR
jgi:hypothetical protein